MWIFLFSEGECFRRYRGGICNIYIRWDCFRNSLRKFGNFEGICIIVVIENFRYEIKVVVGRL